MFDEFLSLHGNAQLNNDEKIGAKRKRILKLTVTFASRKNCLRLFTHLFVAFYSHSQIILIIWNYSKFHLCQVLVLDSINNQGTVFILHRTVEMTIFKWEVSEEGRELPDLMHLRILLSNIYYSQKPTIMGGRLFRSIPWDFRVFFPRKIQICYGIFYVSS